MSGLFCVTGVWAVRAVGLPVCNGGVWAGGAVETPPPPPGVAWGCWMGGDVEAVMRVTVGCGQGEL